MSERRGEVWFEERLVGLLREGTNGRLRFEYSGDWSTRGFPISLTLPLEVGDVDAHAWFTGLLPEGRARERAAREHRLDERDAVGLLFALGRDCAGALVVVPEGVGGDSPDEEPLPLSMDDLAALVASRGTAAFPDEHPRRFSLAGAQDKVAVRLEGEQLSLPTRTSPSTHILKFETIPWVCFAERMGAAIAERAGFEVAGTAYHQHEGAPYLMVTRYDRTGGLRLHQEDLAQALGHPSSEKYEQDGGPDLGQVAAVVRRSVGDPMRDLLRLRDWQLFNYLIGNADGHAKNLSLLYERGSTLPRLAPFYDLVCVELFPRIGSGHYDRSMAFWVGERSAPEEIRRRDWEAMAKAMGISAPATLGRLGELAGALPDHARDARAAFAARWGDNQVYDRLEEVVVDRCRWVTNHVL